MCSTRPVMSKLHVMPDNLAELLLTPIVLSREQVVPVTYSMSGSIVPETIVLLTALLNIEDDPFVSKELFMADVKVHHHAMAKRIGQYLLPNGRANATPRFGLFEENGYVVFKNLGTGNWHIRTKKGDLVFSPRLEG